MRQPARFTFAIARHAVVDLCAVFGVAATPPKVDRLPPEDLRRLDEFLAGAVPREAVDDAFSARLSALRATYEPYVESLGTFLVMPLPQWVPPSDGGDPWHTIG